MSRPEHEIGQTKTNVLIHINARKDYSNEQQILRDGLSLGYLRNICLCTQVQVRQNAGEQRTLIISFSVEHHPPFF